MGDAASRARLTVLAVRHGHAGLPGVAYDAETPLSPRGHRQAEVVAGALSGARPDAIYASPFPRAIESARPLCAALAREPVIDPRLAEYTMAPAPPGERADLLLWRAHHRGVEGGETLADFGERVAAFVEELCARHAGATVVLFTHSGTIDALARWGVGLGSGDPWQHDLPLANASITELVIWPHGRVAQGAPRYVAFERVGDVSHLPPELRGEAAAPDRP